MCPSSDIVVEELFNLKDTLRQQEQQEKDIWREDGSYLGIKNLWFAAKSQIWDVGVTWNMLQIVLTGYESFIAMRLNQLRKQTKPLAGRLDISV